MRDLIYDIVNYCSRNCNMGEISVYDKLVTKNLKSENIKTHRNV